MTRTNLQIVMKTKRISIISIANDLRVSTISVYDVMSGARKSKKIEAALEEAFSLPIAQIRKAWNTQGKPVMTSEIKDALASFSAAANM